MRNCHAFLVLTAVTAALSGCSTSRPSDDIRAFEKTFFAEGYRYKGDVCHQVKESSYTSDLLDHSYDLVACPDDITLVGNIDGAKERKHFGGYRVFSVPRI